MGALLYQRGLFPIHGSAVESRRGAMVFVGAQGIGKSTLAAEFHRQGYRLLSDDVCAVEPKETGLQVLPAHSHVRLCPDAYERLGPEQNAPFNVDKFILPLGRGYSPSPMPLKAIHVLADKESGDPVFELIRGFDRIQRLLENLYRPHFLEGQYTQSDLMRLAGTIAQKSLMVEVRRKRDTELISGLIGFLESKWTEHFGKAPQLEKTINAPI
jgi:hypothetical protein